MPQDPVLRVIIIALILIVATLVGVAAGAIARHGGANLGQAILVGGSTFAGTTLLIITVITFGCQG